MNMVNFAASVCGMALPGRDFCDIDWYQDITYDGLALSVQFDLDGPCEILAASDGSYWTDNFKPHIKSLIFAAAKDAAKQETARLAA